MTYKARDFIKILDHSIRQDLTMIFKAKNAKTIINFDKIKCIIYIETSAVIRKNNVYSSVQIDNSYIERIIDNNDDIMPYIFAITTLIVCQTVGYSDKYQKMYKRCKYYDKRH